MKHEAQTVCQRHVFRFARAIAVGFIILLTFYSLAEPFRNTLAYKGQPAEVWFYGGRTNFFRQRTRESAQKALGELGTNAFPFLFSILKWEGGNGNGPLYFELYRSMPNNGLVKLPYPISEDDIKAATLAHIRLMSPLPSEQVRALADCIPRFRNARLRNLGFQIMLSNYQTKPAFLELCRQLLSDDHPDTGWGDGLEL